ncbi:MAG: DMT family protein [Deltaproteobacteria bacterium]|nr:DMT family protein [Deltaproteobacteria bacterium]
MKTVLLLTISNVFMTIAWYGHLKYKEAALLREQCSSSLRNGRNSQYE